MTLFEIAQIYTDLVLIDDQISDSEPASKEEVGALRSKYHQMLMDKFTEDGIEFHDRFDAMKKAFEIIKSPNQALQATLSTQNQGGQRA
jgi:hypothetical protein